MFDANLKKNKHFKHAGRANFRGSGEEKQSKSKATESSGALWSTEHTLIMSR